MKVCGIDEAGRGPVIGPLVMAGICIDDEKIIELEKLDVKDSKLLTAERRKELFSKIIPLVKSYKIIKVDAQEIDSRANVDLNLNSLEALKCADIINALDPEVTYVDSPVAPVASKFADLINAKLKDRKNIIAEHKADENHLVVAAASILAKVTRDEEIEKIKKEINEDFGSGYPSDEITQKFLKDGGEEKLSKYIRHTWGTIKELKKWKGQKSLTEF